MEGGQGHNWYLFHGQAQSKTHGHHARKDADKAVYENIDPKSSEFFRLANQTRRENVDVVGDKQVRTDAREMSLSEEAKQKACLEY